MFSDPAVLNGGLFLAEIENVTSNYLWLDVQSTILPQIVVRLTARTANQCESFKKRLGQMPAVNFWNGLSLSCFPLF